jgi:excisionase family DNA binding protein
MPEPEYLTPKEAADLLRVSLRTMARKVKSGEVPSVKFGGIVRIPKGAVTDAPCRTCKHRAG